jgi:hypothetical protein
LRPPLLLRPPPDPLLRPLLEEDLRPPLLPPRPPLLDLRPRDDVLLADLRPPLLLDLRPPDDV